MSPNQAAAPPRAATMPMMTRAIANGLSIACPWPASTAPISATAIEPADPRDRAVEPGGETRLVFAHGGEHRAGERCDRQGHSDRHDQDARKDVGRVGWPDAMRAARMSPRPTMTGPAVSGMRGPSRTASLPIIGEPSPSMIDSGRSERPASTGE